MNKQNTPVQRRTPASQQSKDSSTTSSSSSSSSGRSSQQIKKPADQKKSSDDGAEGGGASTSNTTASSANSSSSAASAAVNNKDEEDIYEFKTTPKDGSAGSGTGSGGDDTKTELRKSDKSAVSDDKSMEETPATSSSSGSGTSANVSSGGQSKRPYSEVENVNEDNTEQEDNKRKKRKDSENVKEPSGKTGSGNRNAPQRQDKGSKSAGSSAKSLGGIAAKVNTSLERKSPCASPKPANKQTDSDAETDENKSSDNFGNGGPKVPPLKIVIPQQSSSGDMETGSRNGKNNSNRSHAALPYVVASSSNSNDSLTADKESASSRCASPAESTGKGSSSNISATSEEKNSKATSEERAQQRVLRSSHRSGGSGQGVDRGSNNSSPQLQSSSPSPAAPAASNEANESAAGKTSGTSNASPAAPPQHQSENETTINAPSPSASSTCSSKTEQQSTVELHPRKRKIRAKQEEANKSTSNATSNQSNAETTSSVNEIHPHDHPFTNCYQMFLNIRKQIEKKHRTLFPIQPRPPQGFKDYLMNRRTYVLHGKTPSEPTIALPSNLPAQMKDLFIAQEKERHKLKMQHIVEKEKLGLTVEQEILRVHGKAARSLACQSVPFSACTILKDEEVYNMITPEQEEKDRNARSRYNGRLFISWLQDVDDKWEKIKEAMVLRHHNEAESLHAVQKMDWEWGLKEHLLCDFNSRPVIDEQHVPMVHVSDFDLLPA
ncbi:ankyrin repeat domain-containing protein 11 isoform X2 [Hermetia illucens]|uniref:ankyrin repeat domain-containing protein 11 isoform X2 n=1 Tax=Hermetia illucens TaxID=343691 RepID=UPI0018CBF418|nr:ankyrin repeat domain-containing protein 11 isoform X2 [Hermetia illucens]XP_037905599.1 ankyrin repeat domain-containing protein 11 isoform X2 [Hermetia illucens]XP_037905600.1 ankyrin repeat domain-containing protein 11 isoform X2 [Hermetia illucens]XP_037905601.1 ankyrin repeat domain-containing protein 11 isoform X2 [Hermetia illucens]XP_037905602.1 ankyrin repeat domain-containing protein 11 isoform X2 [Hermetia illucens]XP_037905603.1 ankyrin repeat domain-containing protein 11 isofor